MAAKYKVLLVLSNHAEEQVKYYLVVQLQGSQVLSGLRKLPLLHPLPNVPQRDL